MAIKKYFKIYLYLIRFFFIRVTTYRISFFIELGVELGYLVWTLVFFNVIYSQVNEVAGWSKDEMYFLVGLSVFSFELILALIFVDGLRRLPQIVNHGEFDFILLKPVNSLFFVSFGAPYLSGLLSSLIGIYLMIYSLIKTAVALNLINVLSFFVIYASGLVITYCLCVIFSSLVFIFPNSYLLVRVGLQVLNFSDYPQNIYKNQVLRILLFIMVPVIFFTSIPAETIIKGVNYSYLALSVIMATVFFILTNLIWNKLVKRYSSASS
ncbi:MAG: hypothetical protein GF347_03400 [Candidatus Moranbacteria bacterium]|nr:hypothetical protein [Candidatus Moranbacteria bacterium]